MSTSITQQDYQKAIDLRNTGNVAGAWAVLANAGDLYAGASYNVVADPNSFYGRVVRAEWQATGADLSKFNDVALQHLNQYLYIVGQSPNFTLPTTEQIERSYRTAVTDHGFSPLTAVDATFSRLSYAGIPLGLGWAGCQPVGGLCLETERRVSSNVFSDLSLTDVGATLGAVTNTLLGDLPGTAKAFGNWALQIQARESAAAVGIQFVYPELATNGSGLIVGGNSITLTINGASDGAFNLYAYSNGVEYRELKPGYTSPTGYDQSWKIPSTGSGYTILSQETATGASQLANYDSNKNLIRQEYVTPQFDGSVGALVYENNNLVSETYSHPQTGYTNKTYQNGVATSATVQRTINGNVVNVSFGGDGQITSVNSINNQVPTDPAMAAQELAKLGVTQDMLTTGTTAEMQQKIGGIVSTFDATHPTGAQIIATALGTTIDVLALIKAIQSGEPLPVLASGLRLANTLSTIDGSAPNYTLSGASNVGSGILSLMSLDAALKRGDTLGALTAGAQTLSFGTQAYANLALNHAADLPGSSTEALYEFLNGDAVLDAGGNVVVPGSPGVLPYLNLVNNITSGDGVGTAISALQIANSAGWMAVPGINTIAIAYTFFNMISSLFGGDDAPPEAWGSAHATWSGFNAVANATGAYGGLETATNTYNGVLSYLGQLAADVQAVNPGSAIGIVANRMPSLSYRNYTGYSITDIDPLTGEQRNPGTLYDLAGRPYNAPAGSVQASQSLSERMIRVALERGAVAPLWEVQTAALQTQAGDPMAGLTEEERAGRAGKLAPSPQPSPTGGEGVQTFRAVALDLNGDGVQTTGAAKTVAFDVDDSGYLKNTAWLSNSDGFLFLDRNLNGSIDAGSELFSNSVVSLGERGLAGMRWIDSNYDGSLSALDPVWNELKVWQDGDGDGAADAGEVKTLSQLGITALDYAMGTFAQNGQIKQLSSPDLAADLDGLRTHAVPEGIIVQTSNGHTSLLATRIDDRSVIDANRDGVTGYEDTELIISAADLMANDTLAGFSGANLSITGVSGFTHGAGFLDGNGFVHYTPEANYFGAAGFDYQIRAVTGQRGAANDGEWLCERRAA